VTLLLRGQISHNPVLAPSSRNVRKVARRRVVQRLGSRRSAGTGAAVLEIARHVPGWSSALAPQVVLLGPGHVMPDSLPVAGRFVGVWHGDAKVGRTALEPRHGLLVVRRPNAGGDVRGVRRGRRRDRHRAWR